MNEKSILGEVEDAIEHLLMANVLLADELRSGDGSHDDSWLDCLAAVSNARAFLDAARAAVPNPHPTTTDNLRMCPQCHRQSVERGRCLWNDCGYRATTGRFLRSAYSRDFRPPNSKHGAGE